MSTIRLYDPDTKATTEIPSSELAPGYVACQVEGIEGIVYAPIAKLKPNPEFQHPPFDEEHMALFRLFAEDFKDVYPKTAEQWADGFRRDEHPEREIEIWANIGGAFNHFTKGKSLSPEHRRDYFQLVLAYFNNGPDTALAIVQLQRLSRARAKSVIEELKRGSK